MEEFKISALRNNVIEIRESSDPLYKIYQEYKKEMREIEIEFKDGFIKTIHAYWNAKEAREKIVN